MKHERIPIDARPLARHCDALLRTGPTPEPERDPLDGLAALALGAERITRELGARLARLYNGEPPPVAAEAPRAMAARELSETIGALAANSLFAMERGGAPLVASIEAAAVFRLLDRAFGGRGEAPKPMPAAFPLSSELLIERLEAIVADSLAAAFDLPGEPPLHRRGRDGNLAQVMPFLPAEPLTLLALTVGAGADRWRLALAIPARAIPALTGQGASAATPTPARRRPTSPGEAISAGFGDMPLTLAAVLVDMAAPLDRIAALRPGDLLPVAVARAVPLSIDGVALGRGVVGAWDDRVAVQLSEAFAA